MLNDIMQLDLFTLPTPSMPVLDVSRCVARPINYETAANMVEQYHYAHRVPSIVVAIGMYVDDVLAGCITYGTPATANPRRLCGEKFVLNMLELNRLFIHDWAGRNSESWLIGQSMTHLRKHYPHIMVLLSYSDTDAHHTGYVYQATNWLYTGLSSPGGSSSEMFIDGIRMAAITAKDKFGSQGKKNLEAMGHEVIINIRSIKHRYVYFLGSKKQRRELRQALRWPVLPYPKA